jgi:fatty-acyl-CoA synthase|tara:strand:+ start:2788 stop:4425 length:1638 start_codon:yes stop_codon:yes gene_type:complete
MSIFEDGLEKNQANYASLSPLSFLERSRKTFPKHIAVEYKDYSLNYEQAGSRCDALANFLNNTNIISGSTIAVMLPNIPVMWECHYGIPMGSRVINAINTRLDSHTVNFILDHGEAKLFIYDSEYSKIVESALNGLTNVPILVEFVDLIAGNKRSDFANKMNCLDYETEIQAVIGNSFEHELPNDEWDSIALNYTSGTTGNPKGVVYHHRGAYLNAIGNTLTWELPMHSKYLWTLPMFHCNGWCFPWTITERAGTHVCLRQPSGNLIVEAFQKHKITHLCGAPIVMQMIADHLLQNNISLETNIKMMTAGAPPPEAVLSKMASCGIEVIHVYGLTEIYGPAVVCAWHPEWNDLEPSEQAKLKARQGVVYSVQENMKIINTETNLEIPKDGVTIGEVLIKGNITMKGYLKNEKATNEAFEGGWFHTGDLGVWYSDGYIQLKDRSKDIIISGGENISSIEVEDALYKHPDVLAVAVVAKEDEKWGETPCAFVELKNKSSVDEIDLKNHCKSLLAGFKVPKYFCFVELPKTSTGKIQKFKLREEAKLI